MKKRTVFVMGGLLGVVFLTGIVLFVTHHSPLATHRGMLKATYYCPMHPTYTSDRPGNCPICNMKLVKAQEETSSAHPQTFTSICYLHNCAKLHDGKPCPMTVVAKPGEKVTCPICGEHIAEAASAEIPSSQRKILYWTDPMIPGYRADGPGKSPMGMDLVPVYEETSSTGVALATNTPPGYTPILLTPQKQQLIGVTTALATKRALIKTVRTVGVIAHDPELYQAQQEFIQAYQGWQRTKTEQIPEVTEQAKQLADSSRLRLRHLGLSEEMIDEVSTWKEPDHRLLLGGAGQYWVYASIYEYELSLLHVGQSANVTVDAFPGRTFTGTVKAIDPMLDMTTRTARARIVIEDSEGILKPEMFVNVLIAVDLGDVLAIPEEAVFATGTKSIVFVDKGQGLFEPRDVTIGAKADGAYEIRSGISEGERVVTSGNFLIDSESRLKAALRGAESGLPAAPAAQAGEHQHGQ